MSVRYISETQRVRAALAVIPADDYATWVEMAFAIKQGLGEAGFELWDEWSQTAHNYDARAARITWRSASGSGGMTLASLFWLAREHGFDLNGSRGLGPRFEPARVAGRAHDEAVRRSEKVQARRAAVAREAGSVWRWARPVGPDHPYLRRKQVQAVPTLRELEAEELRVLLGYAPKCGEAPLRGRVLIVPVQIGDTLSTLELIDGEGRKSALAGGAKASGYWAVSPTPIREADAAPILIAEGVATALSAWQASGWHALAALSSGNLRKVAAFWRTRCPRAVLLILADRGAGFTQAREAAQHASAQWVAPQFEADARIDGQVPTDFNDLAVLGGGAVLGEVLRQAIHGAALRAPSHRDAANTQSGSEPVNADGGDEMDRMKEDRATGKAGAAPMPAASRQDDSNAQGHPPKEGSTATAATAGSVPTQALPPADSSAVTQPAATHRHVGEPLFRLDTVPAEIKALAEHRFGTPMRMAAPRENGGPYRGEVFNTEHYLIQEVASRSVVIHDKTRMTFVSERLRWMDENLRLNGAEVQIGYDGERPKVYPWDRARDQLERAVASLKKSAREAGFGTDLDATLDQLQAVSWARVKAARTAALAHASVRADLAPAQEREQER